MKKSISLVSIIMPAYNSEHYILNAIKSVMEQSYENWELIIIDDHSSDSTLSVISKIEDNRLVIIPLNENSGSPSYPRNVGLTHANGEFIAFLDADDIWYNNKLQTQVNYMEINNVDFTCSGYDLIENGTIISDYIPPLLVDYKRLLKMNTVGCLTAMCRHDLLSNLEFPHCGHEDYALWLKILKNVKEVHGINEKLARYTVMKNSVSSNKFKVFLFYWNIYRNEEGFSISKTMYSCFVCFLNVLRFKLR